MTNQWQVTGNADRAKTDDIKAWKKHGAKWFKTTEGGRELAIKMKRLGAWDKLRSKILPLVNAILAAAGQSTVTDIEL